MDNHLLQVISSPSTSFHDLLASQRELFHSQIDHLENIVVHQCKLTGVNPLSQEMAAGALSIKIGKRPRDLLNPKAIKYMQSIFSIKDVINKKETHEISALFGVTATQVRDFFTTQRTRVRKLVRISREKARKSSAANEQSSEISISSGGSLTVDPVPLDSVAPINVEGPSFSTQHEVPSGVEESDRDFIDTIFILMRNEDTFSGQVKLMDWIMEIQNPSVLQWFLSNGGVMILANWLSQAATEEQTSVLHAILKVLCHLPLHQALPAHMSAILQSVNKLRFYRTSDISNRARFLLFRWSKKLASQSSKKPSGLKSATDAHDEMLLKQSIGEVMAEVDGFEESLAQFETAENLRKTGSTQPLRLLTSVDESNKKTGRSALPAQNRERRKVQLVEQPGQRMAGRNPQAAKTASPAQGRPLSADDIQKAKLRAQFLQSKYGKSKSSSDRSPQPKPESPNKYAFPQDSNFHSTTKAHDPFTVTNEVKSNISDGKPPTDEGKPIIDPKKTIYGHKSIADLVSNISKHLETHLNQKRSLGAEEPPWKKCKGVQIPWHTPPVMTIPENWKLCAGENSKEVEIQKNRIHREKETIYRTLHEIPLNPKEPWDHEMDYDDTLTPQIPTEQLPDVNNTEDIPPDDVSTVVHSENVNNMAEPDLELLAVLLKNPELVFALTSGSQAGNLSSEETIKLLDMIKVHGLGQRAADMTKVEVSLPSPTPSSNPGTSGVIPDDYDKNPFARRGGATATTLAVPAQQFTSQPAGGRATNHLLQHPPPATVSSLNQVAPVMNLLQPAPSELLVNRNKNGGALVNKLPRAMQVIAHAPPPQETPSRFHAHPPQASYYSNEPPQSWGGVRQGPLHHHVPQTNSSNKYYNAHPGRATPDSSWRRNEYVDRRPDGFESFSPENSPARLNNNYNHPPPTSSQNPPTYHQDHPNWNSVNRRWSDHRR
ncbi:unnamed protein product [Cuscuta epithymum]|uniref:Homeobox domain-containing protein n=2 Tax=Cuscuta epithymum TaxID=186058 RepID=A0AAV0E521_9ASTE|nr:unnamed protein product [Cuscuta epithymum]CAH9140530.1 unnamed protein product [Cuscuta epithymum]